MPSQDDAKITLLQTPIGDLTEEHIVALVNERTQEDQHLEFKQEALPDTKDQTKTELRKDVVALANGGGGTLLIGIREDDDSRASGLIELTNAEALNKQIETLLLDCIDPPLRGLAVRRIELSTGDLLVVRVEPPDSPPHCIHTSQWTRRFPVRQGRQVRAMTMHEIRESMLGDRLAREVFLLREAVEGSFVPNASPEELAELTPEDLFDLGEPKAFRSEITRRFGDEYGDRPLLRIMFESSPFVPTQDLRSDEDRVRELMVNLQASRKPGWFISRGGLVQRSSIGLSQSEDSAEMKLIICWNGVGIFFAPLDTQSAQWAYHELAAPESPVLNPLSFIEPTVGMVKLARELFKELAIESARVSFEFLNAASVRITRFSKNSFALRVGRPDAIRAISKDRLHVSTARVQVADLTDQCARQLLVDMYAEAGFDISDDAIGFFDAEGRFHVDR